MQKSEKWRGLVLAIFEDLTSQIKQRTPKTTKQLEMMIGVMVDADKNVPTELCDCPLHNDLRRRLKETQAALDCLRCDATKFSD